MSDTAVERPVEREYRSIIDDNLRWNGFTPRADDIFVCTPAKCGTTWMQTIVTTLLFPAGDAPGPVFEISPWIEARFEPIDDILTRLDAQTHRRSIKTHTPADGIPWYPKASYIVVGRDGRDAFMSFLNHMRNLRADLGMSLVTSAIEDGIDLGDPPPVDDVHDFFQWWMENDFIWFGQMATFWGHRGEPNVLFVHYDDMKADLGGEMHRVAEFLGIAIDDARWPALVQRCTFESMKERSHEIGDFAAHFTGGADAFLYKATNGRWRGVLTDEELAAFDRKCAELLPPDAFAWTKGRGTD